MKDLKSGYIFLSVLLMIALSGTFAVAEYHHVEDCSVCHYSGGQESSYCKDCSNDTFVRCVIDTPNSGLRAVIFLGSTGANSYADGDTTCDGVCEVCHTQTLVQTNTGDGVNHFDGSNCIDCHPHTTQPDLFSPLLVVGVESHDTHMSDDKGPGTGDCTDCHLNNTDYTVFADGQPLASTTVCDNCHSPEGAFPGGDPLTSLLDPAIGAKANWAEGIYEADGKTLQGGKEKWCATCHDERGGVVIDNPDATFVDEDDWSTYSGSAPTYGADCRYKAEGYGFYTATWTANISAGYYHVYAWWIEGSLRATNAQYTIMNNGSELDTVLKDQSQNGGQWNQLGTELYYFAAGTASVVLSDDANGSVVADAIKFKLDAIVIDNPDATFEGDWSTYSGSAPTYGADCRYKAEEGDGSGTATWRPDIVQAGDYNVYAWWIEGDQRATNAPYTIHYNGGSETVRANQKEAGTAGQWNLLGAYNFAAGTSGYVVLSDDPGADGRVVADAIKFEITGIYAPNVIGDNTTYGYYVTGHKIDCFNCHDATKKHIDHEHRTYASGLDNYQAGYRLAKPMVVPRPGRGDIYAYLDDFALCGDCHNLYEPLGEDAADVSHTNFWKEDDSPRNSHKYHIGMTYDSDWNGVSDSAGTCINCHNVHGSPGVGPMIRHGELISTYGTTDKVPGLNFSYVPSGEELINSTASKIDPSGDFMNGFCGSRCHTRYDVMSRTPYLGPKVLSYPKMDPAPNDGSTVVLTAYVIDHDASTVPLVTIYVWDINGGYETMYDDGKQNHGDEVSGDGIYSCKTTVAVDTTPGSYSLTVTATDSDGDGTNEVILEVYDPDEVIVDNPDATVDPENDWSTLIGYSDGYGDDLRYKAGGTGSATVTWTPDIPGTGNFNVYAWWIGGGSRATNAPYTIHYNGGSETVRANQKEAGTAGQWNLLGAYNFAAGTSGSVVLSDDADGVVVADAIKWEPQP